MGQWYAEVACSSDTQKWGWAVAGYTPALSGEKDRLTPVACAEASATVLYRTFQRAERDHRRPISGEACFLGPSPRRALAPQGAPEPPSLSNRPSPPPPCPVTVLDTLYVCGAGSTVAGPPPVSLRCFSRYSYRG